MLLILNVPMKGFFLSTLAGNDGVSKLVSISSDYIPPCAVFYGTPCVQLPLAIWYKKSSCCPRLSAIRNALGIILFFGPEPCSLQTLFVSAVRRIKLSSSKIMLRYVIKAYFELDSAIFRVNQQC